MQRTLQEIIHTAESILQLLGLYYYDTYTAKSTLQGDSQLVGSS